MISSKKPATSDPVAIQQDTDKLVLFLGMFCDAKHGHRLRKPFQFDYHRISAVIKEGPDLCEECARLLRHAIVMRVQCPLDPKPKCRNCPQHCYRPPFKDQMETVMKFAGPRSIFRKAWR